MQQPTRTDLGLLALRLMTGSIFVFHGAQKLFGAFGGHGIEGFAGYLETLGIPAPTINAYLAGGTEFVGGIALLTGIFARLFSIPLTFTMLVAAFVAHSGFSIQEGGMEYALMVGVAAAALGLTGPGRFSLGGGRLELPLLRPATEA